MLGCSLIALLLIPPVSSITEEEIDFDPLIDLSITIDILKVRSLEHDDPQLHFKEIIDEHSDPDFYIKVIVDDQEFSSELFWNMKYLYDRPFSVIVDVPDNLEYVPVTIQLWDAADEGKTNDRLCDISPDMGSGDDAYDVELEYDIKTGH